MYEPTVQIFGFQIHLETTRQPVGEQFPYQPVVANLSLRKSRKHLRTSFKKKKKKRNLNILGGFSLLIRQNRILENITVAIFHNFLMFF